MTAIAICVFFIIVVIMALIALAACVVGTKADHYAEEMLMRATARCKRCDFEFIWQEKDILSKHNSKATIVCPNCQRTIKVFIIPKEQ